MSSLAIGSKPRLTLVTGGAGFIGSHLTDALIAEGMRVRVLDNFIAGKHENVNPAAEEIVGDVRVIDSIRPAFRDVDCVFHMAALPRVMLSIEKPVETHLTNVVGTLNALIAARDAGRAPLHLFGLVIGVRRSDDAAAVRIDDAESAQSVRAAKARGRTIRADVSSAVRDRNADVALLQRVRPADGN